MPTNMEYLETHSSRDDYAMRFNLIKHGLRKGRDELVVISKRYLFSLPLVLLVLCNHTCGSSFLRAVLSVLHEHATRVAPAVLIHQPDNDSD